MSSPVPARPRAPTVTPGPPPLAPLASARQRRM